MTNLLAPLLVLGIMVTGWYLLAYTLENNFASGDGSALIIPPPHQLLVGMNAPTWERIVAATWVSLSTALAGIVISVVVGLATGVLMARSRTIEAALWPWLILVQVTPVIVLTPIIVRLVGPSFGARVTIAVLISFVPIANNTLFGIRSIPRAWRDLYLLKGVSTTRQIASLELPAASPAIFAGARVAAGLSVIGAIVGDFFFTRGTPGLGRLITSFFQDTRSGPMFVTAIIASLIGLSFFLVVNGLRTLVVTPWHHD